MLPLEMGRWSKLKRVLAGGNGILELPAEVRYKINNLGTMLVLANRAVAFMNSAGRNDR